MQCPICKGTLIMLQAGRKVALDLSCRACVRGEVPETFDAAAWLRESGWGRVFAAIKAAEPKGA